MDDEEPLSGRIILTTKYEYDQEGVILSPKLGDGEIAVLNPAVWQEPDYPIPFLYRTIRYNGPQHPITSTIDFRLLLDPVTLEKKSRTLIKPEYEWECIGCEDARISKIGDTYYIPYVAYDGVNARIALATTKDFKKIEKHGLISCQIPLEQLVELVEEPYKSLWQNQSKGKQEEVKRKGLKKQIVLSDKDSFLDFNNSSWYLYHRPEPNVHVTTADSIEDFQKDSYWETVFRNLSHTRLLSNTICWAEEKVGLGSFAEITDTRTGNKRRVGTFHGVDKSQTYCGSFFEQPLDQFAQVRSVISNPLFVPRGEEYTYRETNEDGEEKTKKVIFPGPMVQVGENLFTYSGRADREIHVYSTSVEWLCRDLDANVVV